MADRGDRTHAGSEETARMLSNKDATATVGTGPASEYIDASGERACWLWPDRGLDVDAIGAIRFRCDDRIIAHRK